MYKWCNTAKDEEDGLVNVFNQAFFGCMMKFMDIYISNNHEISNVFDDDTAVQVQCDLQGMQESLKDHLFRSDREAHNFIRGVIKKSGKQGMTKSGDLQDHSIDDVEEVDHDVERIDDSPA